MREPEAIEAPVSCAGSLLAGENADLQRGLHQCGLDLRRTMQVLGVWFSVSFVTTWAATKHTLSPLHVLNIMNLGTPQSAVISAIIFNAIVIPLLIPISLRGVRYRPIGASALLRRNLWIYGLGGLIAPFIGIKLIDLVVHNLLGA